MNFGEKLRLLASNENKAEAGRRVGLGPTVISNYVAQGSIPRGDIALKIARAFGVSVEWLLDEEQGLPVQRTSTATSSSVDELRNELGRRMHELGRILLPKLKAAEQAKWYEIGLEISRCDPTKPLPDRLADLAHLQLQIGTSIRPLYAYDPKMVMSDEEPAELIEATEDGTGTYTLLELVDRSERVRRWPGFEQVLDLVRELWPSLATNQPHTLATKRLLAGGTLYRARKEFEEIAVVERANEEHYAQVRREIEAELDAFEREAEDAKKPTRYLKPPE